MNVTSLESVEESIERAVDLLERLLTVADGGNAIVVGQYEASTIVALLTDRKYRGRVRSRMDGVAP